MAGKWVRIGAWGVGSAVLLALGLRGYCCFAEWKEKETPPFPLPAPVKPVRDTRPLHERVPNYPYLQKWAARAEAGDALALLELSHILLRLGYPEFPAEELIEVLKTVKGRDEGRSQMELWSMTHEKVYLDRALELGFPSAFEMIPDFLNNNELRHRAWIRTVELARAGDGKAMLELAGLVGPGKPKDKPGVEEQAYVLLPLLTDAEWDKFYWLDKAVATGDHDAKLAKAWARAKSGKDDMEFLMQCAAEGDYLCTAYLAHTAMEEGRKEDEARWRAEVRRLVGVEAWPAWGGLDVEDSDSDQGETPQAETPSAAKTVKKAPKARNAGRLRRSHS